MNKKIITAAEAYQLIESESDYLPFRIINDAGKILIDNWIERVSRKEQNISAWYDEAESAAMNSSKGETIIIEMKSGSTISNHPETLRIEENCFDWVIYES